ncbi:B3/B4 domain-containing protein [Stetteria hydrogenophila]
MGAGRSVGCEGELVILEEGASRLGVSVAYTVAWGPSVSSLDQGVLDAEVERLLEELRGRYSLEGLRGDPRVRAYRDFYWRIGVDPTKTRPSSEALVRRGLRGRFPRINPLVDAGNVASARHMVPVGLYDLDSLEPPARLTVTRGGEEFKPIGGRPERLPPGVPVLVDSRGRVVHVYPHRDSVETAVKPSTTRILALAAGVPGIPGEALLETLRELGRLLSLLGWSSCPPRLLPTG